LGFGGRQPDYHLHDVAIRHWDGYWVSVLFSLSVPYTSSNSPTSPTNSLSSGKTECGATPSHITGAP
jgi:hypothetical protein